jgi:cytochrome c-type biogenesis protein CcmH/NrfG
VLRRGGEAAVAAEQARAEQLTQKILEAEECFRRGEAALRRDQLSTAVAEFQRAMELNPEEGDYVALHVWAVFCASPDKMAVAQATRASLERAISRSPRAIAPRFYLGRVERMLGRDADALRHFQGVLTLQPHHTEAAGEVRVIEQRLATPPRRR